MISRRTLSRCSPHRHCQIALCSESTGRMPRLPAAFITSPPAITSTSLVASATSFPASSAAIVGARARAPGMATTTRSHRGSVTIAITRASKSGSPACPRIRCSAVRLAVRRPSVSPNSFRRPRLRSMTSSVCRPIEPVAPRMATLTGCVISVDQMEGRHVEVDEDWRKKYRIEPIQDASMAGDEMRGILDLRDSLHLGFDQVADQRTEPDKDREDGEQRPHEPTGLRRVEQQVVVERHADVERPSEPHRPPAQTLAAAGYDQKSREPANECKREHQRDVDLLEDGAAECKEGPKRKQQPYGSTRPHPI